MLNKISTLFNEIKGKFLNSPEAVSGTIIAGKVAVSPVKTFTFGYLMNANIANLKDPDPTEDASDVFNDNELELIQICSQLSKDVYLSHDKRNIPKSAGNIIFEPNLNDYNGKAIPFFVTNSDELNTIFMTCRGSYCFKDFLTDLNGNAANVYGGLMHSGVLDSSLSVLALVRDFLVQTSISNGNRPVIITGHSLGGAVASAIVEQMKRELPNFPIRGIIFAPAASVSRSLWEKSRKNVNTFVLSGDFIPFLSFHNIASTSTEFLPDFVSKMIHEKLIRNVESTETSFDIAIDMDQNPFEKPPPTEEEIAQEIKDQKKFIVTTELFPPGELFLYELKGELFKTVSLRKISSCDYFGRFVLGLNENNHSINAYSECAEQLIENKRNKAISEP